MAYKFVYFQQERGAEMRELLKKYIEQFVVQYCVWVLKCCIIYERNNRI